ncbi:cache domain-containing protein [Poseidonibacter antarcticus]|uniref:cache domain-containing protein n=1 Tax=Poseidonibacter antarcticus TaxID=2478538 RepID=UPI000EF4AA3C|nr:cache domain-containing protein [Poseidonibacter antarcticus]
MRNQVKNLLRIIRFFPLLIILAISILVITVLINEEKREIQVEKINIEKQFLQDEKERIKLNVDTVYNYLKIHKDIAEDELRKDLKSKINNVYKIISNIYINNKDKKSKDEIIQQIKEAVDTIRYNNGNGYFSIHTLDGINILQPVNRSFEGTNIFNRRDTKGNYSIQKAISIAKNKGEGFFTWYFPKPNDKSKEFEKIGIVKKFEPYSLIITTAVYRDDFLNKLKKQTLNYISQLKYKNDGYIYIISFNGDIIYHPSKKLLTANIFREKRFSYIKNSFKELISKNTIDTADYFLVKSKIDKKNTQETNITYSKKFNNWEWIISTNFKLSDANYIIENMKVLQEEKYENYKDDIIFYGLLFTIFFLIISYFISKLLEKEFLKYQIKIEEEKDTLLLSQKITKVGHWKYEVATRKEYLSEEIKIMFGIKEIKDNIFIDYLKEVLHKDDLPRVMKAFNKTLETKKDFNQIYRIHRPNNKIRWISSKATLNEEKGYIKGVAQDITELKELELEKKQKDDMLYQQSKMAAMGEMLGNIAHQWRQPLSTISTASTGAKLQKEMNILSDEQLYKSLTIINDSAQYLSQTIDDFRGFFNPKYNIKKEFDINKAINKTIKLLNSQFNAKNIELIKNVQNHKLKSIENEIIQVLINLLNNARDALLSKEKQRRLIFINTYRKDDNIYLEILDNAGGIEKNIINRIFEPYFTTKQNSQGTGIGLYMSQDIIINHLKGSLVVSNEKYVFENIHYTGAKFIILLPLS